MKKKILLVEDETIIAMYTAKMIEKHGFEVVTVHTGENAVSAVNQDPDISLVLMDMDLGTGIDGTETAEIILKEYDLPIIFLTSHSEKEYVERVKKITGYGYVLKESGEFVLIESILMAYNLHEAYTEQKRQKEDLQKALVQQKKTETELTEKSEKLIESEALYRNLMENSIDGVELLDEDGNFLNVNQRECEMTGYSREELLGMRIADIDPNYPADGFHKFWKEQPKDASILFETTHRHKNGTLIPVEVNGIFFRVNGKKYIYGVARDITERKRSEQEIHAREENLRTTLGSIGDAVIATGRDGRVHRMNPVAEELCGWTEDEALGCNLDEVFHIVNSKTQELVDNPVAKVIRTGKIAGLANHTLLISRNGTMYQIADSAAPIHDDNGDITGVVLVFRDVTEQYHKDRELKERIKELRCLYDISKIEKEPGNTLDDLLQQTAERIPQALLYPESTVCRITVDDTQYCSKDFTTSSWLLSSKLTVDGITAGTVEVYNTRERPAIDEGPFLREERELIDAIAEQIGRMIERRRFEERLRKSEERWQFALESAGDGVWDWNVQANTVFFSPQWKIMLGYEEEEIGDSLDEWKSRIHPDDIQRCHADLESCFNGAKPFYRNEHRVRCKNGEYKWILDRGKVVQWSSDGNPQRFIGIHSDIDARKKNEVTLTEMKTRLQKIIDNSPLLINEIDTAGHYTMVNEATCRLLGLSNSEMQGKHFEEILPPEHASVFQQRVDQVSKSGKQLIVEDTLDIQGQEKTFRTILFPVFHNNGTIQSVVGIGYDMTHEVEALREKDFLMRELNHRVKNNLNMVSSLISLKEAEIENNLSDLRNRIDTIRLVHEKLHQYNKVEHIGAKEYLAEIISSVFTSFSCKAVDVVQKIEDITVSSKTAVPLGLIVNEIATNTVKYGFTAREARFSVELDQDRTRQENILILSNNGDPFPEEIGLNNPKTLGLQLVSELTSQLNGTIKLQKSPHPVFTIRFPVE